MQMDINQNYREAVQVIKEAYSAVSIVQLHQ